MRLPTSTLVLLPLYILTASAFTPVANTNIPTPTGATKPTESAVTGFVQFPNGNAASGKAGVERGLVGAAVLIGIGMGIAGW